MRKKRCLRGVLALLLSIGMLFSVAGCNPAVDSGDSSAPGLEDSSSSPTTPVEPEGPAGIEMIEKNYPWLAKEDGTTRVNDIPRAPDYPEISSAIAYKTYYFDSVNGNDDNDGLSKAQPKKSVDAAERIISATTKNTPTQILFKAGSEYKGSSSVTFDISGFEAKAEAPMLIGVYDQTEEEKYVAFEGAARGTCVTVTQGNLRISGFECFGEEAFQGIKVTTVETGAFENLVIRDCYIHHINFRLNGRELPDNSTEETQWDMFDFTGIEAVCSAGDMNYGNGGIIAEALTTKAQGPSWFQNVWFEDNEFYCVSRVGIWMFGYWTARPGVGWGYNPYYSDEIGWYPHQNIVIRNNYMNYLGGDGVVLGGTNGAFVEGNTCYHAQFLGRAGKPSAGIWLHSCKYVYMQFNEAAYTHTGHDGQGFDIDIGCSYIVFQYNYSHHNQGGGLLMCNTSTTNTQYDKDGEYLLDEDEIPITKSQIADWHEVLVRNNVFADNHVADLIFSGKVDNVRAENNLMIAPSNLKAHAETSENGTGGYRIVDTKDYGNTRSPGLNWSLTNNICLMREAYKLRVGLNVDFTIDGKWSVKDNVFYGFHQSFYDELNGYPEVSGVKNENPQLATTEVLRGYENAKCMYAQNTKLHSGASLLTTKNKVDFLGNDVKNVSYYGAYIPAQ